MKIQETLKQSIQKVARDSFSIKKDFEVEIPKDKSHGDFSTNAAMVLTKELKKNPIEIAEEIKQQLLDLNLFEVESIEVVKPGFINFKVSQNIYKPIVNEILEKKEVFGKSEFGKGKLLW
jgi:arginyl-tRNA synthetase